MTVELEPRASSAKAPQDGATMAFSMKMSIPRVLDIDAIMEMYMWPYGNAGITMQFIGQEHNLTKELIESVLKEADARVVQAEEDF
jgi:hypothetical protein